MSNFHVGQKIVYVRDAPLKGKIDNHMEELIIGSTYTIRGIYTTGWSDIFGFFLEEVRNEPLDWAALLGPHMADDGVSEPAYFWKMFRPATDISVFTKTLTKEPVCQS